MKKYEILKKAKEIFLKVWNVPLMFSFLLSFVVVGVVEALSRHSLFGGFEFLFEEPLFYFMTVIALTAAFSLTYFAPKRIFAVALVLLAVLSMAIVNFVLLFTRITPFEAVDFSILRTGISLVNVYLNTFQLILCIAAIVAAIGLMVLLFIKCPKVKVNVKEAAVSSVTAITVATLVIVLFTVTGVLPQSFKDANKAYDKYGFVYCFTRSIFDRGISQPDDYNKESVDELLDQIDGNVTNEPQKKPNVIIIQLESFMDPSAFVGVEFERDPVPNFTALKENCTSGKLFVPSVGSGTANTEFEVVTGMCLDYFGTGEYPYKTILQTKNCETICYNLAELGYTSHAFHNHTGTFYNRNIVYKNLGFNTFTPVEYMNSYDVNPLGWAKDYVLEGEIMKALESTTGNDLVFAVSVQGHGKYPEKPVEGETLIPVVSGAEDPVFKHQLEYYAYQLYEMDDFIGRLIKSLEEYDEDCVLVFYGDHQPSINYEEEDITFKDKHASEYVIWANFELQENDKDLESYQLSAYALQQVGINNGLLTKLHQGYSDHEEYESYMQLLEYDMLYGDMHSYGGGQYISPDMRMGIEDVTVTGVKNVTDDYFVIGENFTKSSFVYVNGKARNAHYVSPTVLLLEDYIPVKDDVIVVKQITKDHVELGKTKEFVFEKLIKSSDVVPDAIED
ncbi:MAG: sulfatase-like hydrolase/transferase [Clostridia bacterium]|nr:sulfatase-like hydrolase/transferase [Clostridia bacterium]